MSGYKDKSTLRELYVVQELSMGEIGGRFGVSSGTISHWLTKFGIDTRSRSQALTDGDTDKLADRKWLHEQYVKQRKSGVQIAELCEVDNATVYAWLRKHNITVRSEADTRVGENRKYVVNSKLMHRLYVEEEKSMATIADELDVSATLVRRWLYNHGIETRPDPKTKSKNLPNEIEDKALLQQLYDSGMSLNDIANKFGVSFETVRSRFIKYDIERRGHETCHPSGPDHPQFVPEFVYNYGPNWDRQSTKARIRDQARCQRCGKTDAETISEYGNANHIHHITPLRKYTNDDGVMDYDGANDLQNLITLCPSCHSKIERVPIDDRR